MFLKAVVCCFRNMKLLTHYNFDHIVATAWLHSRFFFFLFSNMNTINQQMKYLQNLLVIRSDHFLLKAVNTIVSYSK